MSHARSRHLGNAGNGRTIYHRAQVTGDPNGNRAQRRAWAKSNPAGAKPNQTARGAQNGPQAAQPANPDREARDGQTAAHGPAGHRDGHSTDDTTEELPCPHCRMASPTHDPGCITGLTAAFDTIHTERTETP